MSDVNMKALEKQQKKNKKAMQLGDAARRLMNNRDFKAVVLQEFCVDECARYVHASADPALEERYQQDALNMAQASGHLRRFLEVTLQKAQAAENSSESIGTIIDRVDAGEDLESVLQSQQEDYDE